MGEELKITTASMLEIAAREAAEALREKDARIAELEKRKKQLEEMFHGWRDEARKANARTKGLEVENNTLREALEPLLLAVEDLLIYVELPRDAHAHWLALDRNGRAALKGDKPEQP